MYRTAVLLVLMAALAACGTPAESATLSADEFAAALQGAGLEVVEAGSVDQAFFQVPGRLLNVSGYDVQVFEYADEAAREADSELIAPDGSSIGTSMVTWIAAPTFWAQGRLIVLGLGLDSEVAGSITEILGDPIAGR